MQMPTRPATVNMYPLGTPWSRYVKALTLGKNDIYSAYAASQAWPDVPAVELALKNITTASGTTDASGPALARYGISTEFLTLLSGFSVVEQLRPRFFPGAFRIAQPIQSTAPEGGWVAEARSIPVVRATLGSITLELSKIATISAVSEELILQSSPNAEAVIRKILLDALAFNTDRLFLTPQIAAVPGVSPASITNGLAAYISTGSTAGAIATDLSGLVAALGSFKDVVWLMRHKTLAHIAAHNDSGFLHYVGERPYLLGFPVFASAGSPQQVCLADIGSVALADGYLTVSISGEALLEMDTEPVQGDTSPISAATTIKSLWSHNLVGIKVVREISWQRARPDSVVYMPVAY